MFKMFEVANVMDGRPPTPKGRGGGVYPQPFGGGKDRPKLLRDDPPSHFFQFLYLKYITL